MLPSETDVAVVGAGPTGLALAVALRRAGVDTVLVDRLAAGANTSRAAVVHARTLEVLAELGVTDRLIECGLRTSTLTIRDAGRVLGRIDLSGLATRYPYALLIPQSATESVLLDRLVELGGEAHRPYRVTGVRQDDAHATLTLDDGTGARELRARYVVGADGMHSTVREAAGIGFTGSAYEESFVLADVRLAGVPTDEIQLHLTGGVVVVGPLPNGRHRVVATVDSAPEQPGLADVQAILDARVPGAHADDLEWSSRFRVHHRIAERYRAGRLLIAGDAAHVHSPAGGQGMNTGIQDAVALAGALGAALAGDADALDGYERRRRPVAEQVVAFTDRMTRMATLTGPARVVRNVAAGVLFGLPPVRARIARTLAELDYR